MWGVGVVGAAKYQSRPQLCSPSSAGDRSAAASCLTSLGRPSAAPCRRGHVWARQQTRRRRWGLGAPREVEPRGEDHNHAYRAHSSWGHLFHGSWAPVPALTTLFSAQIVQNLMPSSLTSAGSTLQNTRLKETENRTSTFPLQIGKQAPRGLGRHQSKPFSQPKLSVGV